MPLYEYKCNNCNRVIEALQKINAEPLQNCLYCNGHVEKLISASSFQFKGSGWYATDYKNKIPKNSDSTGSTSDFNKNNDEGKNANATIK